MAFQRRPLSDSDILPPIMTPVEKSAIKPQLKLIHLSWPLFVEQLTLGLALFTDTFFLSWISDEAAASVGLLSAIMLMGYFILPMLSTAGTAVASQYTGAGAEKKLVPTYIANIAITSGTGLVLSVLVFLWADSLGLFLGMTESQNRHASLYLYTVAPIFFLIGLRSSYASILASRTLTHWNMAVAVVTNILNIALTYALVKGFWVFPAMGVPGVALATVVSFATGWLILAGLVHIKLGISLLIPKALGRVREVVRPIVRIALPSTLEPLSYTIQNFVVTVLIITLGTVDMSAHTYVNRFTFLCIAFSSSLTLGGQIVMSYYLGSGDVDKVDATFRRVAKLTAAFSLTVVMVYLMASDGMLSLFTEDVAVLERGFQLLLVALVLEPFRTVNILGGVALKTVGDGQFSLLMGMVFIWGVIPVLWLAVDLGVGLVGIWVILCADEVIRALFNLWRWYSGRWRGRMVIA